jgi:hypothetical protein
MRGQYMHVGRLARVRKVRDRQRDAGRYPHGFAATSKNKKAALCAKPTNNYYTTRDKAARQK